MDPEDDAPRPADPAEPAEPWPELLPEARPAVSVADAPADVPSDASADAPIDAPPVPPPADPHVEAVLQQIRSGVRQRTAEAATAGAPGSEAARQGLLALRQREFVAEPVPFSHRASLGRLVVLARKAVYHLFLKWLVRPVLEQQNGFNQAASRLLQELIEAEERNDRERRELLARVAELERRLTAGAGAAAGDVSER